MGSGPSFCRSLLRSPTSVVCKRERSNESPLLGRLDGDRGTTKGLQDLAESEQPGQSQMDEPFQQRWALETVKLRQSFTDGILLQSLAGILHRIDTNVGLSRLNSPTKLTTHYEQR